MASLYLLTTYVTGFAKRGLIRAITNIEKYRFEILNAVYLENAQSFFHAILHHSTVIQGNSFGVLFNGLLAELPTILDSFFTSTTSDSIGVVGWGRSSDNTKNTAVTMFHLKDNMLP